MFISIDLVVYLDTMLFVNWLLSNYTIVGVVEGARMYCTVEVGSKFEGE